MPLDAQARTVLDLLSQAPPIDFDTVEPASVRAFFDQMTLSREVAAVARVEDRRLPGPAGEIPVRLYAPGHGGRLPGLLYYHGGGFVIGSIETHDGTCRALANAAGCCVVSVDYRLAPEHPFPAAPEDCYAALRWVAAHADEIGVDGGRLAVAGDSAGGNLAAVVAQLCRKRGGPELRHQLLIYPVTDHGFDTPSYRENAEGYMLTRDMMRWFWRMYLPAPADGDSSLASPLRAKQLAGLAPATVITAEFDPLRDEGEAYAARLREAGVPTRLSRYDGQFHGFFGMTSVIDRARDAVGEAGKALRGAFADR